MPNRLCSCVYTGREASQARPAPAAPGGGFGGGLTDQIKRLASSMSECSKAVA